MAMTRWLDDIFAGPGPEDPPEDDGNWARELAELERAAVALVVRLRDEPGLSRAAAQLFVKLETVVSGIFFKSIVWPWARRLARLPEKAKAGRPVGARSKN